MSFSLLYGISKILKISHLTNNYQSNNEIMGGTLET